MEERRLRGDKQLARGAPSPQFSVAPSLLKDFDPKSLSIMPSGN